MRPLSPFVQAWRRLLAGLCLRRGIRCFQGGDLVRAASLIQHSMTLRGPNFTAHLFLGRIYLRLNRLGRARQEFARAQALDAGRFAVRGMADSLLLEMARGVEVRQPVPARPPRRPPRRRHRDDFSSAAERQRFRLLPPIQAEELESIDWNELSGLFED